MCILLMSLVSFNPHSVSFLILYWSSSSVVLCTYTVPPDGPPLNFEISVQGPRTLTFSWEFPEDGVITGYLLSCDPQPEGLPKTCEQSDFGGGVETTLIGFAPSTTYNCTVLASNIAGGGPNARATATTGDDCKHIIYSFIIIYVYYGRCTVVVFLPPQRHCSSCNFLVAWTAKNGW